MHVSIGRFCLCLSAIAMLSIPSAQAQISEFKATLDELKNSWDEEQKAIEKIKSLGGWVQLEDVVPSKWYNQIPKSKRKFVVEVNMVYHVDSETGVRLDNDNRSDECLEAIGKFTQVKRIYMQGTQATDEKLYHLKNLKQVEHFFVWDASKVSDKGLKNLERYRKLVNVHISNGKMTSKGLEYFSHSTSLERLSLQGNGFSNKVIEVAIRFKKLKSLWVGMGGTTIDDEGLASAAKIKTLETIGIQEILATDSGLKPLFKLPKLKEVYVSGNGISPEAIQELEGYAAKNKEKKAPGKKDKSKKKKAAKGQPKDENKD